MTEPTGDYPRTTPGTAGPDLTTEAETVAGYYGSNDPTLIGQAKLDELRFTIDMSEDDVRATAEKAVAVVNQYGVLAGHQRELALRKTRLLGFKSAAAALDVGQFAAAVQTSPALVAGALNAFINQEQARVDELTNLLTIGQAPDAPILTDPSVEFLS